MDCGEDSPLTLEFDHRVPADKTDNVAVALFWTLTDLEAEIALCDIRCSNCHLKRTHAQRNSWRAQALAVPAQLSLLGVHPF